MCHLDRGHHEWWTRDSGPHSWSWASSRQFSLLRTMQEEPMITWPSWLLWTYDELVVILLFLQMWNPRLQNKTCSSKIVGVCIVRLGRERSFFLYRNACGPRLARQGRLLWATGSIFRCEMRWVFCSVAFFIWNPRHSNQIVGSSTTLHPQRNSISSSMVPRQNGPQKAALSKSTKRYQGTTPFSAPLTAREARERGRAWLVALVWGTLAELTDMEFVDDVMWLVYPL